MEKGLSESCFSSLLYSWPPPGNSSFPLTLRSPPSRSPLTGDRSTINYCDLSELDGGGFGRDINAIRGSTGDGSPGLSAALLPLFCLSLCVSKSRTRMISARQRKVPQN